MATANSQGPNKPDCPAVEAAPEGEPRLRQRQDFVGDPPIDRPPATAPDSSKNPIGVASATLGGPRRVRSRARTPAPADGGFAAAGSGNAGLLEEPERPLSPWPDPKRLAYDLWCIQEDRRIAGQPLENLDVLVRALRARYPTLNEDLLQQGVEQFLAFMVVDQAQSCARRQRHFWQVHLRSAPARPQTLCRERRGTGYGPRSGERWG